ncbi:MAG TPA: ferritin-like domain-containing protein, partial [Baekduia sp.]|nr:ferritin-like domain-containing protein [Baekduia sp.]
EQLDQDGAIREAEEGVAGDSRADFLKKAALGSGAMIGGGALLGALPSLAAAKPSPKQDIAILNFALTLEYLESEFYKAAVPNIDRNAQGSLAEFAAVVRDHELAHVAALKKVLGSKAVKKPTFDFGAAVTDVPTFIKTSFALENTGVHAYLGQAGRIKTPALLGAAASIVTVEARHASAVALLQDNTRIKGSGGISPQGSFDTPLSMNAVLAVVKKTGFIKG